MFKRILPYTAATVKTVMDVPMPMPVKTVDWNAIRIAMHKRKVIAIAAFRS